MTNFEKTSASETILNNLQPVIKKMLTDAPDYGTVGLTATFYHGDLKQIEFTSNKSIRFDE